MHRLGSFKYELFEPSLRIEYHNSMTLKIQTWTKLLPNNAQLIPLASYPQSWNHLKTDGKNLKLKEISTDMLRKVESMGPS